MNGAFSIGETLRESWALLRAHSMLLFQVVLTFFALEVVNAIVSKVLGGTLLGILAELALLVLEIFISAGFLVIALTLVRGQSAHYRQLLPPSSLVVEYFLASLLASVIIILPALAVLAIAALSLLMGPAGIILVAAAGLAALCASVYLSLRYFFVRFAAVDGRGVTGSLRASAAMTAGLKWRLLLLALALLALNLLGALVLLVGLVVTVPLSMLALASVYVKLSR